MEYIAAYCDCNKREYVDCPICYMIDDEDEEGVATHVTSLSQKVPGVYAQKNSKKG